MTLTELKQQIEEAERQGLPGTALVLIHGDFDYKPEELVESSKACGVKVVEKQGHYEKSNDGIPAFIVGLWLY